MTRAAAQPTFQADGAPVSVLIDFDGTVSLDDTGDALLARLVEDQDLVRQMNELYMSGQKGSRELIAWDMEVLPRDAEVLLARDRLRWRSMRPSSSSSTPCARPVQPPRSSVTGWASTSSACSSASE